MLQGEVHSDSDSLENIKPIERQTVKSSFHAILCVKSNEVVEAKGRSMES